MNLLYIVCFDVSDHRRLRKISNEIENFGVRVQRSVFECHLDQADFNQLQDRLQNLIDPAEDRINFYSMCSKDEKRIQVDGGQYQSQQVDFHLL